MWIRDFWNRVLAKFRNKDGISGPVMELKAEQAPEPVPERKTSDEMIVEMAESASEPVMPEDRGTGTEPAAEKVPETEMEPAVEEEPETETEPAAETEPDTEIQPENEAEGYERKYFEEDEEC